MPAQGRGFPRPFACPTCLTLDIPPHCTGVALEVLFSIMGRIGDPVTQAAVLFHIGRDVVAGLPSPLTDPWRCVGPDIGLGAAGQVGSPASNATAGILNLNLGALDGVADGLNPFLHILAD